MCVCVWSSQGVTQGFYILKVHSNGFCENTFVLSLAGSYRAQPWKKWRQPHQISESHNESKKKRKNANFFILKMVHFNYQIFLVQSIWSFKWEKYLHTEMRISDSLCFFFTWFSKYWSAHGAIYSLDTVTFWLLKKPAWEATLSSGIFLPRHFISRLSAVKNTI